ncbi:XPG I-region [Paragonimus skrjabini miyazakii]|uniref:XPG I-region n=1 Tax=Paragonimus skrjabini miyazakii TaxID=59628 RepID=A0A8S9YDF4_9TREM|nr:XPG I-region [Paragonimus skrjabini miyazakii]
MRPGQFSDNTLRHMGILAGCDYFSGIPGIGLVTAAKILRQTRLTDFRELLSKLGLYTNLSQAALTASIPSADHKQCAINGKNDSVKRLHGSLIDAAVRAERTFRLQVIFDPLTRSQRRLTEPTPDDLIDEIRLSTQADSGIDVDDKENLFAFAGKIESDSAKAFQIALGNVDFKTGEVLSCFDPDQTQISISSTVPRPHSESSLLNHFARVRPNHDAAISSRSPSSVRPVLGVLASSASQIVHASSQPDKQRLRMSIWNKDFPLQKVWIHRRLNQIDGQPSVHCLSVASVNPVKEPSVIRNAATINTQDDDEGVLDDRFQSPITCQVRNVRIKSVHGKRLFVSNPSVQDKLNRLGKRPLLSDSPVRSPKRKKAAASPPRPLGVDSVTDILKTYRSTSYESVTPNFHLPDRDLLPSTVISSSDYFPRNRFDLEPSVLHTKHREDEVASALQNALDKDAVSDRLDSSRSPVFQRNPFRACPRPQADSNVISSLGYSVNLSTSSSSDILTPSLHNAPIPSAQASGTPPSPTERLTLDSFHFEKSPIFSSRAKPSVLQPSATAADCDVAVDLSSTPSSPNLVDDVEEDDTGELTQLSPNFLNSHLSQPVAALIRPSVDTPNSSSSHYVGIAFKEASPVLKASDSFQLFARSSVDKTLLKSPSVKCRNSNHVQRSKRQSSTSTGRAQLSVPRPSSSSNASLHSYFAKWKFKDAQC